MERGSIDWYSMNNGAILGILGQFIQQTRLEQNKTQQQVAHSAGINRSTISQIEKGKGGTLLSLIQVLRVLEQLPVFESYLVDRKLSPLKIARLEQQKRQRARNKPSTESTKVNW